VLDNPSHHKRLGKDESLRKDGKDGMWKERKDSRKTKKKDKIKIMREKKKRKEEKRKRKRTRRSEISYKTDFFEGHEALLEISHHSKLVF
jgi:hypothetical protein